VIPTSSAVPFNPPIIQGHTEGQSAGRVRRRLEPIGPRTNKNTISRASILRQSNQSTLDGQYSAVNIATRRSQRHLRPKFDLSRPQEK